MYNKSSYISYLNFLSEAVEGNSEQEAKKSLNDFLTKAKEWVSERIKDLKNLVKFIKEKVQTKLEGFTSKLKGVQVKMPNKFGDLLNKFSKKSKELESDNPSEDSGETLEEILVEVKEDIKKNPDKKGFRLFKLDNVISGVSGLLKKVLSAITELLSFLSSSLGKLRDDAKEVFSGIKTKFGEMKNKIVNSNKHIKFSFRIFSMSK